MEPKIIYQDDFLFVIDKPSGWITNDADTTTTQPVLQFWVRENFDYPLKGNKEMRDGIVHRLDKETSGIVLIAKTKEAFENLQAQFKERKVKKTYIALVHGKVEPRDGEINAPVGRLPWRRDRFGVLPGGRNAVTNYETISYYTLSAMPYTLLRLLPQTGRTHQIRIHLKYLGHPVVADEFYAGRKTARDDRKWCPRLFLHAKAISFDHPITGRNMAFKSQLPSDLSSALGKLITKD